MPKYPLPLQPEGGTVNQTSDPCALVPLVTEIILNMGDDDTGGRLTVHIHAGLHLGSSCCPAATLLPHSLPAEAARRTLEAPMDRGTPLHRPTLPLKM